MKNPLSFAGVDVESADVAGRRGGMSGVIENDGSNHDSIPTNDDGRVVSELGLVKLSTESLC